MLKNIWRWELYINYEIALSIDDWWRKALNEEQLSAPSIKVSPNGDLFTNLVRLDSKITKIGPFKKFLVCALKKYYQFSSCFHFTRGLAISQKKRQAILNYDSTGSRHYGNFGGRNDSGGKDECPFPVGMESKKSSHHQNGRHTAQKQGTVGNTFLFFSWNFDKNGNLIFYNGW